MFVSIGTKVEGVVEDDADDGAVARIGIGGAGAGDAKLTDSRLCKIEFDDLLLPFVDARHSAGTCTVFRREGNDFETSFQLSEARLQSK